MARYRRGGQDAGERGERGREAGGASLPETAMVEVTGIDRDGEAIARPAAWKGPGRPPVIFMAPARRGEPALAPGARVEARLKRIGGDKYEGRAVGRATERAGARGGAIVGVYRAEPGAQTGRIEPTDRRSKAEWLVPAGETHGAAPGEIVRAIPLPAPPGRALHGPKPARVVERLGLAHEARAVSLIAIATHEIPVEFPEAALAEAKRARGVALGKRTDLRGVGLVTIDGEDARDFDDAVFAEPDGTGFRLIVAIADVAHYVKPGSALDREAQKRGNSCYFPDRVVPMLPEALSNGWCSLKPDEDRGCLFVEMRIDAEGVKQSHRFGRGLMKSAARLTYEAVQENAARFPHLYAAFRALLGARERRGTLDLDLPERKVVLSEDGRVERIAARPRLDSHRLIEEFMILANVAAAEELERLKRACMYRIHAPPSPEKLRSLREFLRTLDIALPPGDAVHPRDLDRALKSVAGTDKAQLVSETVLRSQSQAEYSPDNIGHFGLALPRYAHFTSPIRRYADLLVHRALISGLNLGRDGTGEDEAGRFEDTAAHITGTERRAALAERDAVDRYLALYLQHRVGDSFPARISGVTRYGLFVTLADIGASGFVPMASLPDDYWMHDESTQTLNGKKSRRVFQLADLLDVRLIEARPITGGMIFAVEQRDEARPGRQKPKSGAKRRR